jgi:hypothetical protein
VKFPARRVFSEKFSGSGAATAALDINILVYGRQSRYSFEWKMTINIKAMVVAPLRVT